MQDDFDGGVIDAELWQVTLPYSNPPRRTVKEDGGSLELFRRGIIDSAGSLPDQIDIEGRFRFTGEGDTLSIVLRSDLTVTNQFERRGVQVALLQATGRVFLIPEPFVSVPIRGSFVIGKDTDIAFRMIDDG